MTDKELITKIRELWKERIYLSIECYTQIGSSGFDIINTTKKLKKTQKTLVS